MIKKNGIYYSRDLKLWGYALDKKATYAFKDKTQAAREYVRKVIEKNPKFSALVEGRTEAEQFRVFGIEIRPGE